MFFFSVDLNKSQAFSNVDVSSEDKAEIIQHKEESSNNDEVEHSNDITDKNGLSDAEEKEYEQFEQECREKLGLIDVDDMPKASHLETE